ncbi:MAG: hypothetical protein HQM10_08750 [Candidatus Riflebacteria bacterium]|nr:hypothetical protein [Candidatus Riflebacteria bacterium]
MNKILRTIMLIIVVFPALFYIAYKLIILPDENKYITSEQALKTIRDKEPYLKAEIQKLSSRKSNSEFRAFKLLSPGKEDAVLNSIFDSASRSGIVVADTFFLPVFVKKIEDEKKADSSADTASETLPMIGEDGMPIGYETDEAENGKGLEVFPVKIKLLGNFENWGKFLTFLDQSLNLHGIRLLNMEFNNSGVAEGNVEIVLPYL